MASQTSHAARSRGRDSLSRLLVIKLIFLAAGTLAFLFSVYLWFLVDQGQGLFVGLWVPSVFALGSLVVSGIGDDR
jgi:ABC-type multidrug transport system permease subunit